MLDWLTIFGAGVMTFVTPCVLPLVPIYLAALGSGEVRDLHHMQRRALASRAALFCGGFIAVFVALGLTASSLGGVLAAHRGALQLGGGIIILIFGCKYLGIVQIPWLDRVVRTSEGRFKSRFGGLNAMLMGAVFGAGWSPCVGPILGSVLTYTASRHADAARGAGYLAMYGLGLALPLMATALFVQPALRALQGLRPHLHTLERLTGVMLIVAAGWLLSGPDTSVPAPGVFAEQAPSAQMVELFSRDCGICRQMEPVVAQVEQECMGAVRVQRIDVSEAANRHWVSTYRLVGVPTFLFVDAQGTEVARLIGRQTPETLRQAMAALRGEECPGVEPLPDAVPAPPAGQHSACSVDAECG